MRININNKSYVNFENDNISWVGELANSVRADIYSIIRKQNLEKSTAIIKELLKLYIVEMNKLVEKRINEYGPQVIINSNNK